MTVTRHTVDTSLVKKGHTKNIYDRFKLQELKKCLVDPIYFLENYMKIQHPTRGGIEFHPYDYQRELIENYANNRFAIALLPRQSGKCLVKNIDITIRNKKTGEIQKIAISDFYEMIKEKNNK